MKERHVRVALATAVFALFMATGGLLLVRAVVVLAGAIAAFGDHPELALLEGLGLLTVGAAVIELGEMLQDILVAGINIDHHGGTIAGPKGDFCTFVTMVVVVLSIEAVVLIFRGGSAGQAGEVQSGASITVAAALLLVALALYLRLTRMEVRDEGVDA